MSGTAPCTPREFIDGLTIITDDGPALFGSVMADFQRVIWSAAENGLRKIVGLPPDESLPTVTRHMWELSRGSAKTTLLAAVANYVAYSSPRSLSGQLAAGDADQARLQVDAARLQVRENPNLSRVVRDPADSKLKPLIDVQQNKIRNVLTGTTIEVISTDAGTAYGRLDDLIICDEFTNLKPNARPFFDALISTAAKKKNCVVFIVGNAPFVDSWQWEVREAYRTDPRCHFFRMEGPSPWMTPEALDEQRRILPPMAYRRLFDNQPVEGQGDALSVDVIDAAFSSNLPVMMGPGDRTAERYAFVGALDLSVSRDWSAFVIVARNSKGRYRLARSWTWRPLPGQKISQENVRAVIREAHRIYNLRRIVCDPFQAEATVELLQKDGLRIESRPQNGPALMDQAMQLVELFNTFAIDLPADPELRKQLLQTRVEQRSYGVRLVSPRSTTGGHGDLVSALSIALPAAKNVMPLGGGTWGGMIAPTTRGLSTTRSDPGHEAWKFQQHLNALQGAGVEVLASPYRTVTPNSEGQQ